MKSPLYLIYCNSVIDYFFSKVLVPFSMSSFQEISTLLERRPLNHGSLRSCFSILTFSFSQHLEQIKVKKILRVFYHPSDDSSAFL